MLKIEVWSASCALLFMVITGSITIENRYAKAVDVHNQMSELYRKTLKLRILELELKPKEQFSTNDAVLLEHMKQELRETSSDL